MLTDDLGGAPLRGRRSATLVEQAPEALRIIEANRAALGLSEQTILVRGEVSAQLSRLTGPFDVVVADPPYRTADWEALLAAIAPLLAPEGVALFEHTRGESLPTEGAGWLLARTYAYGATLVARYERPAPPGS